MNHEGDIIELSEGEIPRSIPRLLKLTREEAKELKTKPAEERQAWYNERMDGRLQQLTAQEIKKAGQREIINQRPAIYRCKPPKRRNHRGKSK